MITSTAGKIGAVLLALLAMLAIIGPIWINHPPDHQNLTARLLPPIWAGGQSQHWLGTDTLGRDVASRLLHGGRIALLIAVLVPFLSFPIGCGLGMIAGYRGGRADALISVLLTVRLALPTALVALTAAMLIGPGLVGTIILLGLLKWERFLVVARGQARHFRQLDFLAAAKLAGIPTWRILLRDLLPNLLPGQMVIASLVAAEAILLEATLSFLGLGLAPPTPSWGSMIADGRAHIFFQPWLILLPGLSLALLILALNLLSDGLAEHQPPMPG